MGDSMTHMVLPTWQVLQGDALARLREMPSESVHMCVTSPPYFGLRDYGTGQWAGGDAGCDHKASPTGGPNPERYTPGGGEMWRQANDKLYLAVCLKCGAKRIDGQIGLEGTPAEFIAALVGVFREVKRVLRRDGVCFINMGDSYGPNKQLMGMPWRVAFALQEDNWILRSEITWCKRAPMPESVTDRPTSATEKIFLLTRSPKYYYDAEAVREPSADPTRTNYKPGKEAYSEGNVHGPGDNRTKRNDGFQKYAEGAICNGRNLWNYWLLSPEPFSDWKQTSRLDRVERGDVSDGMMHKVHADCPVHGDRPGPLATAQHGQHEHASESRIARTDAHPVQEQSSGYAPIHQHPAEGYAQHSLGLQDQPHLASATDHSNGSHRTDHAPVTSPPYTPSVGTSAHTGDTSELPASSEPQTSTDGHSNGRGASDAHSQAQTPYRIVDKSSLPIPPECLCSFYHEVTEKTSHFATFPTEIPRRAIRAGTSEWGCCSECGAQWRRVVEREFLQSGNGRKHISGGTQPGANGWVDVPRGSNASTTTGWQPTCAHKDLAPVPCTVLDPFSGAGTTGLVALELGRNYIGIELNEEYVELSRRRIQKEMPLIAWGAGV